MFESCARPENVKEFKEKFGFNFESCDGIFLLQATCIYIFIKYGLKVKEEIEILANKKIDDLVAEFEKTSSAPVKKGQQKNLKQKTGRSKPRIVKVTKTIPKRKAEKDESSTLNNKYHKRFIKTKKPVKL